MSSFDIKVPRKFRYSVLRTIFNENGKREDFACYRGMYMSRGPSFKILTSSIAPTFVIRCLRKTPDNEYSFLLKRTPSTKFRALYSYKNTRLLYKAFVCIEMVLNEKERRSSLKFPEPKYTCLYLEETF